jgi:epoxyqueuosine reductase
MKQKLYEALCAFMQDNDEFRIGEDVALDPSVVGLVPYDLPLVGVGEAEDEWFTVFQQEGIVGPHHRKPCDWLPSATRVISVFMRKSEQVRASNRGGDWPSNAWLHARFEGQQAINKMSAFLVDSLKNMGYDAVAPSLEAGFKTGYNGNPYTSNWSERHVAYACDLGTFSLSKGLITGNGVAGRFFSVVTNAPVEANPRQQRDREAACTHCGLCAVLCPAGAISMETGKDHAKCNEFLKKVLQAEKPRYGCGKCQTGTPCEFSDPTRVGN